MQLMSILDQKNKKSGARIEQMFHSHHARDVSPWRIFKIMSEFVAGFEFLRRYERAVSFFGSARENLDPRMYKEAESLAARLSKAGFAIITGGGAGIMEAANKGAYEMGGESVGLNIRLPEEQHINKYVKDSENFEYFFSRKVMLSFASHAYIFFPGGYGTLNELFEMVELVQTKKIEPIPIILVGRDFWMPMLDWIKNMILGKHGAIKPEDMDILHLVNSADEAFPLVQKMVRDLEKKNKHWMR